MLCTTVVPFLIYVLHNPTGCWVWLMNDLTLNEVPTIIVQYYCRPQTKLWKGNVFTPVCDSVHRGVCTPPTDQADTQNQADTPWTRQAPPLDQADTPRPGRNLSDQVDTPKDGHCSGQYASYWNAFLFVKQMYSLFILPILVRHCKTSIRNLWKPRKC